MYFVNKKDAPQTRQRIGLVDVCGLDLKDVVRICVIIIVERLPFSILKDGMESYLQDQNKERLWEQPVQIQIV